MGLFDFLKVKKKPKQFGGIVQAVGLNDFWNELSEDERQQIRDVYKYDPSGGVNIRPIDIDHPTHRVNYPADAAFFLEDNAKRLLNEGYHQERNKLADKLLAEAKRLKE